MSIDNILNPLLTIIKLRIMQRFDKGIKIYKNAGQMGADTMQDGKLQSVVYGVYRNQTSQIGVVSDGLNMLTGSVIIDFLVDAMIDDETGDFPEVNAFVDAVNYAAGLITGQYYTVDGNAVLPVMSPASVGVYQEESSNWGAYIPVSVQLAFTALEGATSPADVELIIDGRKMPVTEVVMSRVKASTADVSEASNGETVSTEESSTFEIQFASPYTDRSRLLSACLYGDEKPNTAHCVIVRDKTYGFDKCYLMSFAKALLTRQSNAIVGVNANMLELSPNVAQMRMADGWDISTATVESFMTLQRTFPAGGDYVVYWGDGTSEIVEALDHSVTVNHTYYVDGICKIIMYELPIGWGG